MKTCFKCSRTLPLVEFYRHPRMGDGHLGKCKACTRRDVREHRAANIERIREYDRSRATLPHRLALRNRVTAAWAARHPERRPTHARVSKALRAGKLTKPEACQRCGRASRLEGHHHDYSKPLDVEWLCKPCHAQADSERRAAV